MIETRSDLFRPQYHFTAPQGWINDPNGLVFFQGEYHLFYQHKRPLHWGHAVSTDLVYWRHLPIALAPDELGDIWSGSVVVDWNDTSGFFGGGSGLVAIFTHHTPQSQSQSLAFSHDNGRTWSKYAGNPVLTSTERDFRDPKVFWHAPSGRWAMVLATGTSVSFYTSTDLRTWVFASRFMSNGLPGVWECPDLFALPVDEDPAHIQWVLNVSSTTPIHIRGGAISMHYFVGDFDGERFSALTGPLPTTYGADDYAAVSWSDIPHGDRRRIWLGWMSHWNYARQVPTDSWQGMLTLPRGLALKSQAQEIRLVQQPVRELEALRQETHTWHDQTIGWGHSPGDGNFLAGMEADACEIIAEFEVAERKTLPSEFGLRVRVGEHQETRIGYIVAAETLFVDRTRSGASDFHPGFPTRHIAPLGFPNGRLKLQIFVDRCSIEVFGNDGAAYVADLIFPDQRAQKLEVYADGGTVTLSSLTLYHLASIWDDQTER